MREAPRDALAAVGDEVCFHEAWQWLLPVRECPHRDVLANGRRRSNQTPLPSDRSAGIGKEPVDRCGTHLQQFRPDEVIKPKVAMLLERDDQQRDERLQPLAADPV